jgi:hypothetical protein
MRDGEKTGTGAPLKGGMMHKGLMPNEARTRGPALPSANMDYTRSGGAKDQKAPGGRTA